MKTLSRHAPLPSMLMAMPFPDEDAGEVGTGELAALIGVEDVRSAVPGECLLKRLDGESRLHADR